MEAARKTRTPTQPRAQRTREALLRAGERQFSDNGYATTTSKSIAARAGVATGTFYVYFADKDVLLRELARERQLSISGFALDTLNRDKPAQPLAHEAMAAAARARMQTVVAGVVDYHRRDPGLHAVLAERRHVDAALDAITTDSEHRWVAAIADLLRHWGHQGDQEASAFVLFGMVEGAVHTHVLGTPYVSDERFQRALVEAALLVTLGPMLGPMPGPPSPEAQRNPTVLGPTAPNSAGEIRIMPKLKLNHDWSQLMDKYDQDHQNKINQMCHTVGIPLIAGSVPVGATIVGLPLAAGMFTLGWGFQFVGHAFEGKKPSFVDDYRSLAVGLIWWAKKVGLDVVETTPQSA